MSLLISEYRSLLSTPEYDALSEEDKKRVEAHYIDRYAEEEWQSISKTPEFEALSQPDKNKVREYYGHGPDPDAEGELNVLGGIKDIGKLLYDIPVQTKGAIGWAREDRDPRARRTVADEMREAAEARTKQRESELTPEQRAERILPFKLPFMEKYLTRGDVLETSGSTGFSAVAGGAALGAAPIALLPVPGARPAAAGVGMAASGKAAYEMDRGMFTEQLFKTVEQATKRELTADERKTLIDMHDKDIFVHAIAEGGFEAAGNVFGVIPGLKNIFKGISKNGLARVAQGVAQLYGVELATETATQHVQQRAESRMDITPEEERAWGDMAAWNKSFQEVAPQTFLLSSLMGTGGAVTGKVAEKIAPKKKQPKDILKAETLDESLSAFTESLETEAQSGLDKIDKQISKGLLGIRPEPTLKDLAGLKRQERTPIDQVLEELAPEPSAPSVPPGTPPQVAREPSPLMTEPQETPDAALVEGTTQSLTEQRREVGVQAAPDSPLEVGGKTEVAGEAPSAPVSPEETTAGVTPQKIQPAQEGAKKEQEVPVSTKTEPKAEEAGKKTTPIKIYRGEPSEGEAPTQGGPGMFWSQDRKIAEGFGGTISEHELPEGTKRLDLETKEGAEEAAKIIGNPYLPRQIALGEQTTEQALSEEDYKKLKAAGIDVVSFDNIEGNVEYVLNDEINTSIVREQGVVPTKSQAQQGPAKDSSKHTTVRVVDAGGVPEPRSYDKKTYYISAGKGDVMYTLRVKLLDRPVVGRNEATRRDWHVRNLGQDWSSSLEKAKQYLSGEGVGTLYASEFDKHGKRGQATGKPMPNEDSRVLPFGKYKGKTIDEVYQADKDYLVWFAQTDGTNPAKTNALKLVADDIAKGRETADKVKAKNRKKNKSLAEVLDRVAGGRSGFATDMANSLRDGIALAELTPAQAVTIREIYGKQVGGRKNSKPYKKAVAEFDEKYGEKKAPKKETAKKPEKKETVGSGKSIPTPETYDDLAKIPIHTVYRHGDKYAIRGEHERGMGDSIYDSLDEAEAGAVIERKQAEDKRAREGRAKDDETAKAQRKAEQDADDFNGFAANMTPMQKGKLRKTLSKSLRFSDGKKMSRRERVEFLVKNDKAELGTIEEDRVKPMSRRRFNQADQQEQDAHDAKVKAAGKKTTFLVGGEELTKTGYDYAEYLLHKEEKPKAAKPDDFSGSKAVDSDGKLIPLLHGTTKKFNRFDKAYIDNKSEGGFFFTPSLDVANYEGFAKYIITANLNIKNPYITTPSEWYDGELITPEQIKAKGHDGIIIKKDPSYGTEENKHDVFLVFEPDQIRILKKQKTPKAAKPADAVRKYSPESLAGKEVQVKMLFEGKEINVTEDAETALADLEKEEEGYRRLIDCLKG